MVRASAWFAVLFCMMVFSGCADGDKAAVKAAASADTGGIEGIVVDEEQAVVAGAAVGIQGGNGTQQTTTSPGGVFSFAGLIPGSYTVVVQAPFFTQATTKVDVVVGEVAKLALTLKREADILASTELYLEQKIEKGFINMAYSFPWTTGDTLGGSLGQGAPNERSHIPLEYNPTLPLKEVVLELVWQPGTGGSGTSLQILICSKPFQQDFQNNCFGFGPNPDYRSESAEGPSPLRLRVFDLPIKEIKDFEINVGDGGVSQNPPRAPITAQQAFEVYITTCYHQNCTADYTMLPS